MPIADYSLQFKIVAKPYDATLQISRSNAMTLSPILQKKVNQLLDELDIPALYKAYVWKKDTWETGFPDLFRLEQLIRPAARNYSIGKLHLIEIAKWGALPNWKNITCSEPVKITLYSNDSPVEWLTREPENAVWILEGQTRGFGPTYCSKLLHFAVPQVFGAIDTRLVRTFGEGDPNSSRYSLLNLKVAHSGERWAISSSQIGWPGEYGNWTDILNYIAKKLNDDKEMCPHPENYYEFRLRPRGIWYPADVETALFSFASQAVKG